MLHRLLRFRRHPILPGVPQRSPTSPAGGAPIPAWHPSGGLTPSLPVRFGGNRNVRGPLHGSGGRPAPSLRAAFCLRTERKPFGPCRSKTCTPWAQSLFPRLCTAYSTWPYRSQAKSALVILRRLLTALRLHVSIQTDTWRAESVPVGHGVSQCDIPSHSHDHTF